MSSPGNEWVAHLADRDGDLGAALLSRAGRAPGFVDLLWGRAGRALTVAATDVLGRFRVGYRDIAALLTVPAALGADLVVETQPGSDPALVADLMVDLPAALDDVVWLEATARETGGDDE